MQDSMDTLIRIIDENSMPPFLNAFGRNIIPVPMNALSNVKNVLLVVASPVLGGLLEDLRRPSNGLFSLGWSSDCPSGSPSTDSSSDSPRSSPAKFPYRSRKLTKLLVTGVVTLLNRSCCRRTNSRRKPPGARCS